MRTREEYARYVRECTGFSIQKDDPTLVFLAVFELFEKDFREMARNTLGSWIPLLDSRRKSFNDALNLRAERVLHEAIQQSRASAELIAGDISKQIGEHVRNGFSVECSNLQQRLNRMQQMVYICVGSAVLSCIAACAGVLLK